MSATGRDRAAPPAAKPLRLFVAVDVPPEVKDALERTIAPYRPRVPAARWTRSTDWHVTLKFLGSTWPRMLDTVESAVRTAARAAAPVESRLTEVGVFPSERRARVVWAGLEDGSGALAGTAKGLDDLLADLVEPEGRAFTPHLTLARINPARDLSEFVPDLVGSSVASEPFAIDRLVLYRSHLSPHGATYEALVEAPFEGR
jgi:RNA 2',3'-cyclic 3'-phosphodiesterase